MISAAAEGRARELDAADPLAGFRARFRIPHGADGTPVVYLCGNSLGLMPIAAERMVAEELEAWGRLAVDGHFHGARPWYRYHEGFRAPLAALVGAHPDEIVLMNGLTVNLHLLMVSFFRPRGARRKILIEHDAFPSDGYVVRSQLRFHDLDPVRDLVVVEPRPGERTLRPGDVESAIDRHAAELALVFVSGVHFLTGEVFDLPAIAERARSAGAAVGFDLAHAVGNVPLALHDCGADFAAWCSYKYLNGGPGAIAGAFVHRRHAADPGLPRFAGWWGNDPDSRFRMQLEPDFVPAAGADGWQLSNPPVIAMAPILASLDVFEEAGMSALRAKSRRLTGFLVELLDELPSGAIEILTPREPERRGCQLSIRVPARGRAVFERLLASGFVGDWREPDVLRVAPVPLYNTYREVWRFARALAALVEGA